MCFLLYCIKNTEHEIHTLNYSQDVCIHDCGPKDKVVESLMAIDQGHFVCLSSGLCEMPFFESMGLNIFPTSYEQSRTALSLPGLFCLANFTEG